MSNSDSALWPFVRALLAIPLCIAGCSGADIPNTGGNDLTGAARFAITAQSGVQSVQVTVKNQTRVVSRCIKVDGATTTLVQGLPTGAVEVIAAAYASDTCTGNPTWLADEQTAQLVAGQLTAIQLLFHPNGEAMITGGWIPDEAALLSFQDNFDAQNSDWTFEYTPGAANVYLSNGDLVLETIPNTGCATASARAEGKSFNIADGTVIYEIHGVDFYVDQGIYGDAQPRGLADKARTNAIEFINAYPTPNHVTARTVSNGVATETASIDIGKSVRSPAVYRIEATSSEVRFFVDGTLVATHHDNIPTVPIQPHFSTGDSCAGNVPVVVDSVSVQLLAQ